MRYEIKGENLPVVICNLEQNEQMITERGGMAWMSPNMRMETTTGGGLGRAIARKFSGDSIFQNIYTAEGGNGLISFASSFPGEIRAFEISPGNEIIAQKKAFLASEAGVDLSIYFHKRFASGLFGGEGFILQKLSGRGIAFVEFDGSIVEYELQAGQQIYIDTGHLAAMSAHLPDGYQDRSRREKYPVRRRGAVPYGCNRPRPCVAAVHAHRESCQRDPGVYPEPEQLTERRRS